MFSIVVDVRIPWIDDGKSYWLVVASSKLSDDDLEFRDVFKGAVLNGAGMPSHILAFSPLAQREGIVGGWKLMSTSYSKTKLPPSVPGYEKATGE